MIYVFSLKVKNRYGWQGMQLSEQQFRKKTFLPCQLAEFHFSMTEKLGKLMLIF